MLKGFKLEYLQLLVLNIGLVIGLYRQMSVLFMLGSFFFIVLTIFFILKKFLKNESKEPIVLITKKTIERFNTLKNTLLENFKEVQIKFQGEKKNIYIINGVIIMYLCLNLFCGCFEIILAFNIIFLYFMMPDELNMISEKITNLQIKLQNLIPAFKIK